MTNQNQHLLELDDATFDRTIREAEGPVLVDFWAEWCQPCRMLGPTIEELANEFAGRAVVAKLDVDANRTIAERSDIRSIPTVIVFRNGEPQERFVGLTAKETLASALAEKAAST